MGLKFSDYCKGAINNAWELKGCLRIVKQVVVTKGDSQDSQDKLVRLVGLIGIRLTTKLCCI